MLDLRPVKSCQETFRQNLDLRKYCCLHRIRIFRIVDSLIFLDMYRSWGSPVVESTFQDDQLRSDSRKLGSLYVVLQECILLTIYQLLGYTRLYQE